MIDLNKPVKFKKKVGNVSIEFEVNQDASVDDFKQIEYIVNNLYDKYIAAVQEVDEERRIIADMELKEKIKKNPCYLCAGVDRCNKPNKGVQKCSEYMELPF